MCPEKCRGGGLLGQRGAQINKLTVSLLNLVSLGFKSVSGLHLKLRSLRRKAFPGTVIISVDNLSFGGTGKTPLVLEIGRILGGAGIRFSVVTRGYGSLKKNSSLRVETGHDWREVGDEVKMISLELPFADVYAGRDRIASVEKSIAGGCRAVILDDGFQTAGLKKDIRIMLINPEHPYYYLRNFRRLARQEDLVLYFNGGGRTKTPSVHADGQDRGYYSFELTDYFDAGSHPVAPPDYPLFGFSALGDNRRFREDIGRFEVRGFRGFRDHHVFTGEDIASLESAMRDSGADSLICTQKDFVKLKGLLPESLPLIYVKNRIKCDIDLEKYILKKIK